MSWSRITNPKNIERIKEFDMPMRWYVSEFKACDIFKDTELLWRMKAFLNDGDVVFMRLYRDKEVLAKETEGWKGPVVVSGKRFIAKICHFDKQAKVAVVKL